jgi:hypothetical protein
VAIPFGFALWVLIGARRDHRGRVARRQGADQRVKYEVAGAEVGGGGADPPAGDELERGGRWGPAVDVQPHAQVRAQRSPGQADLDAAGAGVAVILDRPAQQAVADPEFAAVPRAPPAVKSGHACLERDVGDPPE